MENPTVQALRVMDDKAFEAHTTKLGLLHSQFRMRIGKVLLAAEKRYEDPVEFGRWYEEVFAVDAPTARKYMRIATRYADSPCEDMGYSAQLKLVTMGGSDEFIKECRQHFEQAHIGGGKVTAMAIGGWITAKQYDAQREEEMATNAKQDDHRQEVEEQAQEVGDALRERVAKQEEEAEQRQHQKEHFKRQEANNEDATNEHKRYGDYKHALLVVGLSGATEETVGIVNEMLTKALSAKHPEKASEYQQAGAVITQYLKAAQPTLTVVAVTA